MSSVPGTPSKQTHKHIDISSVKLTKEDQVSVHHAFYFNADSEHVQSVHLLGSFNDWNREQAVPMVVRC
jgi:hypothetical protein